MTTTVQPRTGLVPKRLYRIVSIAEAVTWTLLILGMVAKYGFDADQLIFGFGLAHGTAFVAYAATALLVGLNQRWRTAQVVAAIAAAVVPYATIPLDRAIERRGMLEGDWRSQATDDPRDDSVIDRALRWSLRNPVPLAAAIILAVAVIVTVLLQLGPPSEWGD